MCVVVINHDEQKTFCAILITLLSYIIMYFRYRITIGITYIFILHFRQDDWSEQILLISTGQEFYLVRIIAT